MIISTFFSIRPPQVEFLRFRHRYYLKRFKATQATSKKTGFGVTADDKAKIIFTIRTKLEKMCPLCYRMHDLYGDLDNVNPPAIREVGRHDGIKKTLCDASSNALCDEAFYDTSENGNSNDSMRNINISYNNGS